MRGSTLLRIPLALAALTVVGWSAGSLQSTIALERATKTVAGGVGSRSPNATERAARGDFRTARRFGDDTDVLLKQAGGQAVLGDVEGAAAAARRAARREPQNIQAWLLLYSAERMLDPARAAEARVRALRLDPQARATLRP